MLREEYGLLTHAIPMLEAVDQVAQEHEPNPALYRMLTGALRALAELQNPVVTSAFFWKLLSLEGIHPMLDACARCGRDGGPEAELNDAELVAFDLDEGGTLCRACARGGGWPLSSAALELLRRMLGGGLNGVFAQAPGPETHEVEQLGIRAVEHHVERRLRSTALALDSGSPLARGNRGPPTSLACLWQPVGDPKLMERVVNLAKRRGLVFPSSEIYGGFRSTWDYGPLGVLLKRNVKDAWWRSMVQLRDDIVGLDAAILMAPKVWEASGHVATFTDPLVDCRNCKERFRADQLPESGACPNCGQKDTLHRGPQLQPDVQDARRPGGERHRRSRTSGPRPRRASSSTSRTCRPRRARSRRSVSRRSASRSATRSRPATSSSARASSSRWRWSSSCRPTEAPKWFEYWVAERYRWYTRPRHPRGQAAHPAARDRRALALLRPARATSSSRTRGVGASSRASRTAATTTSPSTPSSRARTSRTSTRSTTSTTCRT